MREFEVALHHNVTVLRKKRLIVLMKFPNPPALFKPTVTAPAAVPDVDADRNFPKLVSESLRQYLRQYTYIDLTVQDWESRLLYALPINGMLNDAETPTETTPLLHDTTLPKR